MKIVMALESAAGARSGEFDSLPAAVKYLRGYWRLAKAHDKFDHPAPAKRGPREMTLARPTGHASIDGEACGPWDVTYVNGEKKPRWCSMKHRGGTKTLIHHWVSRPAAASPAAV